MLHLSMSEQFINMFDWTPVYHSPIEPRDITILNYIGNCHIDLRFRRCHLRELCIAFGMVGTIVLDNRSTVSAEHGFLFLLNRMASLKTLVEHEKSWGRDYTVLSRLYKLVSCIESYHNLHLK